MISIYDHLAPFATNPFASRGRYYQEDRPSSSSRTEFQRDRDRIIHSGAFRKLQNKTQVFVYDEGDYFRTRLTHSLEVGQIARSIARTLALNEDLAECVALAHDLGHTCFGHAGEDALNDMMRDVGGFDHNDQTLRIVTLLERKYAAFNGLNLSWESLEGIVKHNGPILEKHDELAITLKDIQEKFDLEIGTYASAEAQIAAIADDIAYNNHDFDDGIRAGLLVIDELLELPVIGHLIQRTKQSYPDLDKKRLIYEAVSRMTSEMVLDVVDTTKRNIIRYQPKTSLEVRHLGMPLVAHSQEMKEQIQVLRVFLHSQLYRHEHVNEMTRKSRLCVKNLYEFFTQNPSEMPQDWFSSHSKASDLTKKARVVGDYIAGMTDRYAILQYEKNIGTLV